MEAVAKTRIQRVAMNGIVKQFPGVLAVDQVDFDVHAGEIHALLGENGAGKSTLMKILYGLYQADEGTISINDQAIEVTSPTEAISHGIGMIHQHFMLVPSLTVAENVALGMRSSRGLRLDLDVVSQRLMELSQHYNLHIDPTRPIWQLSVGERQRVEILRALYKGTDLLILDEPTAVLTPQEADNLFDTLRIMANDGHSLVFISHKLNEVLKLTHRISVLRGGAHVATIPTSDATKEILAEMMVGHPVVFQYEYEDVIPGKPRLTLEDVTARGETGDERLKNVSFEVRSGEIVGIAGVSGNGQRELAEAITGLRRVESGKITLGKNSLNITNASVAKIKDMRVSYIPEERMEDGIVKEFTVTENYILRDFRDRKFTHWGWFMNFTAIGEFCQRAIKYYEIKTPTQKTRVRNLSGGNIQKLILARELDAEPEVIIAAQPTRGVDIGAIEYIHRRLLEQRSQGTAILLISEDLDEILLLADRILVMYEGEIVGEVLRDEVQIERIGAMMAGAG
jgi:simple sugar transport system ATP-binding protein